MSKHHARPPGTLNNRKWVNNLIHSQSPNLGSNAVLITSISTRKNPNIFIKIGMTLI